LAWLGRIFLILFACFIASLAAGMVVTLAVLLPAWSDLALGPPVQGVLHVMVAFGAIFVSGFALLPGLIVILLAEAFAIRTLLYYAAAGALIAALLYLSFRGFDTLAFRVNGFARRELEIMAAAGIVAGFAYWAIAGRSAGAWQRQSNP
jgi:hypothetical protein